MSNVFLRLAPRESPIRVDYITMIPYRTQAYKYETVSG